MKLLKVVSQKDVIDFYLAGEATKKNNPIPSDCSLVNFGDPNAIDDWLSTHAYKHGVLGGFRQWALVELSTDDIGDIAIVNHIFASGRVLKHLAGTRELAQWVPNRTPLPIWYEPLNAAQWSDDYTVILRPPTPGERREGAALYAEDGSGRCICYYRSLLQAGLESKMRAYVGFSPNPQSTFLSTLLEQEFAINAARYSTLETLQKMVNIRE